MKQKILKIGSALLLGIAMFALLLLGLLGIFQSIRTANAEEGTVTATVSVDEGNEIVAGDYFTLTLTVTTTLDSTYTWAAMEIYFTILNEKDEFTGSQYLEVPEIDLENGAFPEGSAFVGIPNWSGYDDVSNDNPSVSFKFSVFANSIIPIQEQCTIPIRIKVKEGTAAGTQIKFAIDEEHKNASFIGYYDADGEAVFIYADDPSFSSNSVTITVREKSNDNTLSSVAVGTKTENVQSFTPTSTPPLDDTMRYDYTDSAVLSSVNITPTANSEHATIYMAAGSTLEPKDENKVESGKPISIDLSSGVRAVTILVVAENGATKTYTVTVVDKYVALSALKIEVGTKTDGVTKIGLESGGAFDTTSLIYTVDLSAPLDDAYTVDVPSDYASSETGVKITPTIAEGHDIQPTVALTENKCTPANKSVASGSAVQVTGIENKSTLTLTATASDNETTEAYTITFNLLSVETGTLTVKVQGAEKEYVSDDEKAAEKKINYYFLLTDEAECKGKLLITDTTVSVQVKSASGTAQAYDPDNPIECVAGTYTIILTAPAGNVKEYIALLSKMEFLELAADSTYQFIFEETEGTGARAKSYLRTYHEKGMTHGVDDKNFEKVVLGNISPKTTINMFLANISPSQRNMIRIFNNKDQILYDCGADIEGIDKANYDKWTKYRVSTSWYVQYGGTAENPLETIYISILGDVNANGTVDTADISKISSHLAKKKLLDTLEVRLAAYVTNSGKISTKEITQISRIVTLKSKIEDFHYKPASEVTGA